MSTPRIHTLAAAVGGALAVEVARRATRRATPYFAAPLREARTRIHVGRHVLRGRPTVWRTSTGPLAFHADTTGLLMHECVVDAALDKTSDRIERALDDLLPGFRQALLADVASQSVGIDVLGGTVHIEDTNVRGQR